MERSCALIVLWGPNASINRVPHAPLHQSLLSCSIDQFYKAVNLMRWGPSKLESRSRPIVQTFGSTRYT